MPKNIFLTGFMGAGKSTVGRVLSRLLKLKFVDLDSNIAKSCGKTITKIFEAEGEDFFRKVENENLEKIFLNDSQVVSLGGGTLTTADNLQKILVNGRLFYLKADLDTLVRRVIPNSHLRPLLKDKNAGEIRLAIAKLLHERENVYMKAPFTIDTVDKSVTEIAESIISCL